MILCNVREFSIFEDGCYILCLEHIRIIILSSYLLLARILLCMCRMAEKVCCLALYSSITRVLLEINIQYLSWIYIRIKVNITDFLK